MSVKENRRSLTVVIPAHNEGSGIRKTILEIDEEAPINLELVIYVSEDGSRDQTRAEVVEASKLVERSTVLLSSKSERLGYSKAVQRGIRECKSEFICFMDADGQCDPRDMKNLLKVIDSTDVVVGFRNPRVDGKKRAAYSKLFYAAYRTIGGPKLKDPSSPFVIARTKDVFEYGDVEWKLDFGFWWEFQVRLKSKGLRVIEVPINHRQRLDGQTQVYTIKRLPRIVKSHLLGLQSLRRELNSKIE